MKKTKLNKLSNRRIRIILIVFFLFFSLSLSISLSISFFLCFYLNYLTKISEQEKHNHRGVEVFLGKKKHILLVSIGVYKIQKNQHKNQNRFFPFYHIFNRLYLLTTMQINILQGFIMAIVISMATSEESSTGIFHSILKTSYVTTKLLATT